ncbi:MAG: leucine-rich repeat protein [Eubacterium sp.]|nr:leucine-rich repeat protein [Eubacterium sp.]
MTIDKMTNSRPTLLYRIVAFISALAMLLTMLPDSILNALADAGDGEFTISLSWNNYDPIADLGPDGTDYTAPDPDVYIYDSDRSEDRVVRLKISYTNKKVSHEYAPGTLSITVNGIKGAVRTGNYYIPGNGAVAADPEASDTKTRDWSYSYSPTTDTFTFTNNKAIGDKSTFEGSFEIMWTLPSRQTIHDYSQDFRATLTADGNTKESNVVTYKQYRRKDTYTIGGSGTTEVESWETPVSLPREPGENGEEGYTWVNYHITAGDTYLARDVEGSERFDLYFPEDVLVFGAGLVKDESKTKIGDDGKRYVCYSVEKNVTASSNGIYLKNIMAAYPLSEYPISTTEDPTNLKVYAELWGKYYEENTEELLAEALVTRTLDKYQYEDRPGPVYDADKHSYGVHSSYIDQLQNTEHGAVNSVHLTNGEGDYYSDLTLELNYNKEFSNSYDLEFYDDLLDITYIDESNSGGKYRVLTEDEYNFTYVTIPSSNSIKDKSGNSLEANKYYVDIYVRYKSADPDNIDYTDYKLYRGNILVTSSQQKFSFTRDDIVGVKVVYRRIDQTLDVNTTMVRVGYAFHISPEEIDNILTDGGSLVNNMFFLLYGWEDDPENPGEEIRVWWNPFSKDEYIGAESEDEYDRDVERYGDMIDDYKKGPTNYGEGKGPEDFNGLDREKDTIPIVEIPNEFLVSETTIVQTSDSGSTFEFSGSMTGKFIMDDSTDLTEYSMYTIIPEGLRLIEIRNNPEMLLEVLNITSSDGLSKAFLASHLKITIVDEPDKYNGRQFIKFDFDFSDSPIHPGWIKISGIPMYVNKRDLPYGAGQYTFTSGMLVHQSGKWYSNSTDDNSMDSNNGQGEKIWSDLDKDGDTDEPASFKSSSVTYNYSQETHVALTKFIRTTLTNGAVNTDPGAPIDEIPMTYMGGDYWYILRAEVGAGSSVNHIVFADVIESVTQDDSEWQGIFAGVDYTDLLESIGCDDPELISQIKIYYSEQEETFEKDAAGYNIINEDIFKSGGWTTVKPADEKIRSVAVDFGEIVAPPESVMNLVINMKAPVNTDYLGLIAKNSTNIGYWKENTLTGDFDEPQYLSSNVVPVRYVAEGMIVLNKKDAVDGTPLTGATFYLYKKNPNGDPIQIKNPYAKAGEDEYLFTVGESGRLIVTGLDYGEYYFVEQSAPKGYDESSGWMLDMQDNRIDDVELNVDAASAAVNFLNARKGGTFTVKKVSDLAPGTVLPGATFRLYKSDGTPIPVTLTDGKYTYDPDGSDYDIITDGAGKLTVDGLPWGSYYLQETAAPTGYEVNEAKITFTVNAKNDAGRDLPVTNFKDPQIPAGVEMTKYELNPLKYDQYEQFDPLSPGEYMDDSDVNGVPVAGAVYNLYIYYNGDPEDKKLIATRTTNADGVIRIENLAFGTYYFEEIQAANGYLVSVNKVFFELTPEHTNAVPREIITADPRALGNVSLLKKDDAGMPVKGAKFVLLDSEGNKVKLTKDTGREGSYYIYDPDNGNITEMETTDEGFFRIDKLPWGDYYLKETEAPRGYELDPNSPYKFTVDNAHITVEQIKSTDPRKKGILEITKIAEGDNNPEPTLLQGAVFNLYKNDGTLISVEKVTDTENGDYYKVVADGDNFDIVNETGVIRIEDIDWGSYYLLETKAPSGYGIYDKKIRFSVNYLTGGVVQAITVEDPVKQCEFTVTKKIENDEIVFAHGNPTFIFEVTRIDDGDPNDVGHTYRKSITFNHGDLNRNGDTSSLSVKFKVPAGTYKITEISVNRYKLESIAVLNGDTNNVTIDDDSVTVILTGDEKEDEEFEFEFTNKKTDQEGTSDTVIRPNILSRERKLTAIIANYTGPDILTEEKIDTSKLEVWAVYDDGTQELLKYAGDPHGPDDKCYTMDPDTFNGDMNGNYTVTVFYEENGIERTDTFDIEVRLTSNFAWEFIEQYSEPKYDEYGNEYWGEVYITAYTGTADSIHFPAYVLGRMIVPDVGDDWSGYFGDEFEPYEDQTDGIHGKFFKVVQLGRNVYGNTGRVALRPGNSLIKELTFEEGIEVIGQCAFNSSLYRLDSDLVIPDSLVKICEYSFQNVYSGGGSTHNIIFGNDSNLERIGMRAFQSCTRLANKDLVLPGKLKIIEEQAFGSTGLNGNLTIQSIQMIGYRAFESSRGLNGILKVSGGIYDDAVLCDGAFGNTNAFTEIIIGEGIVAIGLDAFASNSSLTKVTFPDSLLKISVNVDDPTTTDDNFVTNGSFQGCTHLATLELPKNLEIIGDGAFANCNSTGYCFTEVEIPASVQKIGRGAFYNDNIEKLILPAAITSPDGLEISVKAAGKDAARTSYGAFQQCRALKEIAIAGQPTEPGKLVFPDGVTVIGYRAFYGCSALTGQLVIPDSVTLIDEYAFYNCTGLTGELTIPDSVTTINNSAFSGCYGINSSINIGNGVSYIGPSAFNNCYKATGLYFKNGGEQDLTIDYRAFYSLKALACDLVLPDNLVEIKQEAFYYLSYDSKYNGTLSFGENSRLKTIGMQAFWSDAYFIGTLSLPASVESIGARAFNNCSGFTSIVFEEGDRPDVLTIGESAFESCGFTAVTIPAHVKAVSRSAFNNCKSMATLSFDERTDPLTLVDSAFQACGFIGTLTIPEDVVYVGNKAFSNCPNLTGLKIEENGRQLIFANQVFSNCTTLSGDIKIPDRVVTMGNYVFENCSSLKGSLIIGNGLKNIGLSFIGNPSTNSWEKSDPPAFEGDLIIGDGVTMISVAAFQNLKFKGNLSIGNGVTSIAANTFQKTLFKGTLTLGNSIETIGDYAFDGVPFSGDLTIPDSVTTIGNNAFSSTGFNGELTIPDGVKIIGGYAFDGSGFIGDLTIPDSVQILGVAPFRNCKFNGDLYIGSGLNPDASDSTYTMGYYFFRNCTFKNVTILSGDGASGTQIGGNVLYGGTYTGKLTVGGNIATIAGSAFKNENDRHTDFSDVEIQDSVRTIGNNAFQDCTGLTGIIIGNSVETIGDSAFNGCTSLSGDLTIPDSVTSIGGYAFRNTNFVGKLVMSQNIKSIGNYAFWLGDNADLTGIVIFPDDVTLNSGVLWGVKVDVYYPDGANDPSNNGANIKYKYSDYTDLKSQLTANGVPQSEWPDWLKNA